MKDVILIYNARLLDESTDENGSVLSADGKILFILKGELSSRDRALSFAKSVIDGGEEIQTFDAEGLTLTPAFIDTHVHLRDPGQTQKEDLVSGLSACAHGGYGTVVAMPNTNPVISSAGQALEVMHRAASLGLSKVFQSVSITCGFDGKDTSHLEGLDSNMIPLVTEDGHDVFDSSVMLEGMKKAAKNRQIVSCHCEDVGLALKARPHREKALSMMKEYGLSAWGGKDDRSVPSDVMRKITAELSQANSLLALAEDIATERNIQIAKAARVHVHICHISTRKSLDYVRFTKKAAGLFSEGALRERSVFSVTCEATPHHMALTGDSESGIRALVNPPLRSEDDRLSVIEAIKDGTVDCIATDHAPHTAEDKANGAPGFTGIEAAYGVCMKVLVAAGHISERRLSSLMSANPARILNLKKGLLKEGYDADFALVSPREAWTLEPEDFFSKGRATPFEKMELTGRVKGLFLSGRKVF